MSEALDHLKSLHTSAIDARNGYQEALDDAAGAGMTPVFHKMMALHADHAAELAQELVKSDEHPDDTGSFMTVVHKTIMDVRSLFNGLDASVLPGLIDGEQRNVSKYDAALKATDFPPAIANLLTSQRDELLLKIDDMKMQERQAKGHSGNA